MNITNTPTWTKWLPAILVAALLVMLCVTCSSRAGILRDYETSKQNEKALLAEIANNQDDIQELCMAMSTLENLSDSISQKLTAAKSKTNSKDREIKNLQYMLSTFSMQTDTVYLTDYDTVFRDPDFEIDTLLGDTTWLNVWLHMSYPNIVHADITAKSEKEVVISNRRETIDPPKAFFLCRWFQKRHTVTTVDIIEENPYITSQQSRFIKISK